MRLFRGPSTSGRQGYAAARPHCTCVTPRLVSCASLSSPAAVTQPKLNILSSIELDDNEPALAYEIIQGPLVRWTTRAPGQTPPTAVMVHGIMGNKRNLQSFARMLAEEFPSWQILLVDLRCHGESARLPRKSDPHTVRSAASDVLRVVRELKLFPTMLIGHSFGGKVVMSMVQQFGRSSLPKPVQVWALDTLPGEVRSGDVDGSNKPGVLIKTLRSLPLPITSRQHVIDALLEKGFSVDIARWAATNLRPQTPQPGQQLSTSRLGWSVDLDGIADMYRSYKETSMWPLLEAPPQGLKLDFVKAEGSNFRWAGEDEARIHSLNHQVHLLRNSGHWVHTDNPKGLFDILAPSFGTQPNRWRSTTPEQN